MNNLKKYIIEKLKINRNININKEPEVDTIAYDYGGNSWKIKAVAPTDDFDACADIAHEYTEKDNHYSWINFIKDELKSNRTKLMKLTKYIIGAESSEFGKAWFIWGEDGLFYKK